MRRIMSFPKRFVFAVRYGYQWYKVDISCQERTFEKALHILEKMRRNNRVKIKLDLKNAQVLFDLSRYQECMAMLDAIVPEIETDSNLTEAVKNYCAAYVHWMALKIKVINGEDQKETMSLLAATDVRAIDLAKIPRVWKTHFPLRIHPGWTEL